MTRDTIICDLDGTLADLTHRLHTIHQPKKDWKAFHAGVKDDSVHEHIAELLHSMMKDGYKLIFVSGRMDYTREATVEWLDRKVGIFPDEYALFMRAKGDYRPDYEVKQEILDKHLVKDRILFVLDDRNSVVNMWRNNGIPCLQVAEGDF
jgi:hydroxymethylpyrimidine pyrophosphatase-like HAD family hydrolase